MTVVIVGASLAGIRCAEALREGGFAGRVVLIGDEPHLPYTRPPLSKQLLDGSWQPEKLQLRNEGELHGLDIDVRLSTPASSVDVAKRTVVLEGGEEIAFDGLVVASGARARSLPNLVNRPGVHTLRTMDDALALRDAIDAADSVVVIGGGFIGAEVAASARRLGKQVTIVEPQETILMRGLGPTLGKAIENLHAAEGVEVRSGVSISDVVDDGSVTTLSLDDGTELRPEVIVVGVGASPVTEWLDSAGVGIDDGVLCDEFCHVLDENGDPLKAIVAAGDVARWKVASQQRTVRLEHWTNAQEQAKAAADTLLVDLGLAEHEPTPFDPTPYVWSDQFGKKIQVVGYIDAADTPHVVKGSLEGPSFLALMERNGQLVGAVAMAMVPALVQARMLVDSSASWEEARAAFAD